MDISSQLNLSTETFFQQLEKDKDSIQNSWFHITNTLNAALKRQDTKAMLDLIPYMEQGDGLSAYEHIGESRKVLTILHFTQLELAYQKTPFVLDCTDKNSLLEKYTLALFSLRRLSFRLSEASTEEAVNWLLHNRLSVFAIYVILQEEMIIPDEDLYGIIVEICSAYWTADEQQLFISLAAGN